MFLDSRHIMIRISTDEPIGSAIKRLAMTDGNQALKKAGLKITLPRVKILELMQSPDNQHISAEDLYKKLLEIGEEIGLATVYRVLNQFDDAGILNRHHFESGKAVFEMSTQQHHDHLVCLTCDKVIEFTDDVIERRQDEIAMRHNIKLTHHSLYLYGHCTNDTCDHADE
jgi:Fur family ferric uptake transcriptional regulator